MNSDPSLEALVDEICRTVTSPDPITVSTQAALERIRRLTKPASAVVAALIAKVRERLRVDRWTAVKVVVESWLGVADVYVQSRRNETYVELRRRDVPAEVGLAEAHHAVLDFLGWLAPEATVVSRVEGTLCRMRVIHPAGARPTPVAA